MRPEGWLLLLSACLGAQRPPQSAVDDTALSVEVEPWACEGPGVVLGTGETSFRPLNDGETLAMIHGVQGGYHIPLAVRACGVGESGQFHYLGTLESGEDVVNVTLTQWWLPEDGCCSVALDVYGYIYLEGGRLPPELAGQRLALSVEVIDATGLRLSDSAEIELGAPAP